MRSAGFVIALLAGTMACSNNKELAQPLIGDEAPIRVKSGSIEIDLLSDTQEWRQVSSGDAKRWKISGGVRNRNDYVVVVLPTKRTGCQPFVVASGTVAITHGGGTGNTVTFKSTGNHTTVTSREDLTGNGNNLRYESRGGAGGFIEKIVVDGGPDCTFTEEDGELFVALLDR